MRPNVTRERRLGWYVLGIATALSLGVGWYFWNWSRGVADQVAVARQRYRERQGEYPLSREVANAEESLAELAGTVRDYKRQVEFRSVPTFDLKQYKTQGQKDWGYLFKVVYDQTRDELTERARRTNVDFATSMGFDFPGDQPPPDAETPHWSIMLQLVSKAVFLALETNFEGKQGGELGIRHVSIAALENGHKVATGPAGRPPLLREYPFQMTVQGSLKDITWLIYELTADKTTAAHRAYDRLLQDLSVKTRKVSNQFPVYEGGTFTGPLIVRGLTISSENMTPIDQISQLTVVIDLAGMVFLTDAERGKQPTVSLKVRPDKQMDKLKIKM